MDDLATWLDERGLGQYAEALARNDVDLDVLPHLTDDDLKALGLSLGHRRKLMAAAGAVAAEPPAAETPAAEMPARQDTEAERRQVTVLFCDLVGSTELSQTLDPEELRELMRRYHDTVATAVTAHNGHVAKLLGDGVLAYFGWPHAHEAQAEMAVRAGLAANTAVSEWRAADTELAARVGIATGPVVIGDMTGEATSERGAVSGATPNLAARLQALAAPGEVVIDEATRQLAGADFTLDGGEWHRLKGFAEPVPAWRVRGTAATDSRFDARHGTALTAFVGRTHELGLLADRWRQARDGEGQAVLISGEAGIGKSRILREFQPELETVRCRVIRYQCSPHEVNAAFQPLLAEIELAAGFAPDDAANVRLAKLTHHFSQVFDADSDATALIGAALGLSAPDGDVWQMAPLRRKQRTIALLAERIVRLARDGPVALLVEDIHWIDPSSLEMLDVLVERLRELPVLAVLTHRPEFQPRWTGHGHVSMHSLNRLGRGDGRAIAERVAGGKTLPDEVLARIVAQTDGIPLFVEELTKTVLEADVLEEHDDRYVLRGHLPDLEIPTTLQDSLMARLDRLAPVKRVIQAAACIGREFDAALLAAALTTAPDALDEALEELVSAQLIFRRTGGERTSYVFKHALVQDAAYASLLLSVRRSLHKSLAQALERLPDPDSLQLARHFSGAGVEARAAALYLSAGQRSLQASALPEAIGALELGLQAAERLPASDERRALELPLRVALGTARMANFGWAHPLVAEALEPAFALARQAADLPSMGSIFWGLWVHYQTRANFPKAHEWLDELEPVARENATSNLPMIYDMSAGCQCFWEADYVRAIGHTDHLKANYRPRLHAGIVATINHDPLVFSQHWAGSFAEWIRGYPVRSIERLEEAVDTARRLGHPFNRVFALTAGVSSLFYLDETGRLLNCCDEAAEVVAEEALGPFAEHVLIMQWRGGALIRRGDFEAGHELAGRGNAFWNQSAGRICNAMFGSWIALGLAGLGRLQEATERNARNIAHCRESGDRFMEPECVRLQGELALKATDGASRAGRLFADAMDLARAHGARSWELRAATSQARLWQTQDRRADAVACLEPVLEWFTEGLDSADLREAHALRLALD